MDDGASTVTALSKSYYALDAEQLFDCNTEALQQPSLSKDALNSTPRAICNTDFFGSQDTAIIC